MTRPGPRASSAIAERNRAWLARYLAGDEVTSIAAEAGKSERLVYKVLGELGAPKRPPHGKGGGRASTPKLTDTERAAARERRRAYLLAYIAERRLRPDVRRHERERNADYREANREALREAKRRRDPPFSPEERAARAAERHEARGQDALQAMLMQVGTMQDTCT